MKKEIRLSIGPDGAEIVTGDEEETDEKSDLVRTSAEGKIRQAIDSTVVGLGDVAGIVLDVFEIFTNEAASRNFKEQGKMTVSFGITGGANANLKFVGAKAEAFMTVQLEIASNNIATPQNKIAYRDRDDPHRPPLPHHAAYGSVLRGSADQAESDPGEHKTK